MRLHRLDIIAFGPFGDSQSVDFDELSAAGLGGSAIVLIMGAMYLASVAFQPLVGRMFDEPTVYRAAHAFEQGVDWRSLTA